jgi:protein TonB
MHIEFHRGATMFEESLVESTTILRNRNHWPAVISITLQASLAIALIALPVLHPEVLSLHAPSPIFFTPPPPTPPPPPPERAHLTATSSSATSAPATVLINALHHPPDLTTAPEEAPSFNPTRIMTGGAGSVFSSTTTGTPAVHVVPASSIPTAAHHGPLTISTGVSAGLLLAPLHPIYPPIAIAARTEGTVVVQAIISRTGHITSAHVLSGPLMLQSAALDAVRAARYRPFLLNNQPTEVDTTFTINFRLGGND